ncbi:hypothetical protein ABZ746_25575 [Streptomyces sp. NPDC020096]
MGHRLPVIVFSHGVGRSMNDYAPLVDFWAAHGFVVIQPTHLDSRTLGLSPDDPRTPLIWRFRVEDMKRILDRLDLLEASVPGLDGRLDRSRIAAVGHSWGGQTAATWRIQAYRAFPCRGRDHAAGGSAHLDGLGLLVLIRFGFEAVIGCTGCRSAKWERASPAVDSPKGRAVGAGH